jgi:hypothetical protein
VQQRRQLQDLAVPAAGKRGRPAVAGPRESPSSSTPSARARISAPAATPP